MYKNKKKKVLNDTISKQIIETDKPKRKGAPLGNQYWRERADMSVDGRKLSIEDLKTKILEYVERCTGDKLYSLDWVGKDATQVARPHMIVMSIWGACAYLGINTDTWKDWRKAEKYSEIIIRAEILFRSYNIEGASAGLLNQNIIARLENLNESVDITSAGEKLQTTVIVQNQETKNELDKLIQSEKK